MRCSCACEPAAVARLSTKPDNSHTGGIESQDLVLHDLTTEPWTSTTLASIVDDRGVLAQSCDDILRAGELESFSFADLDGDGFTDIRIRLRAAKVHPEGVMPPPNDSLLRRLPGVPRPVESEMIACKQTPTRWKTEQIDWTLAIRTPRRLRTPAR